MKAIKANKVYTITEAQKSAYLSQGYDITDDNGTVLERSPTAVVSRKEYDTLLAENEKLRSAQTKTAKTNSESKKG